VKPSVPGFRLEPRRRGVHWRSVQTGGEAHVLSRATVPDPKQLFNSSLEGNVRRAIDVREGEKINVTAFKH